MIPLVGCRVEVHDAALRSQGVTTLPGGKARAGIVAHVLDAQDLEARREVHPAAMRARLGDHWMDKCFKVLVVFPDGQRGQFMDSEVKILTPDLVRPDGYSKV